MKHVVATRARWIFCWACWRLTLHWPQRWMPWRLLPFAGEYAYSDTFEYFARWRLAVRRAGGDMDRARAAFAQEVIARAEGRSP